MNRPPVATALSQGPCPSVWLLASRYLGEYLAKIEHATALLDDDQIWWRPAAGSNSVANLMLHLHGNLSLWVLRTIGGEPFVRDRSAEFAADRSHRGDELRTGLAEVVGRCRRALEACDGRALDPVVEVQGYTTDLLGVVFHAVEHMSYHTGQILSIAKSLLGDGHGIELYPQHRGE